MKHINDSYFLFAEWVTAPPKPSTSSAPRLNASTSSTTILPNTTPSHEPTPELTPEHLEGKHDQTITILSSIAFVVLASGLVAVLYFTCKKLPKRIKKLCNYTRNTEIPVASTTRPSCASSLQTIERRNIQTQPG